MRKKTRKKAGIVFVSFMILLSLSVLYVGLRVKVFQEVNLIERKKRETAEVSIEVEELRVWIAQKVSQVEIERIAMEILGMRYPKPNEVTKREIE